LESNFIQIASAVDKHPVLRNDGIMEFRHCEEQLVPIFGKQFCPDCFSR
jgi:hypothetical protein